MLGISRLKIWKFSAAFRTVGSSQVGESRASDLGTKTVHVVQKFLTYVTKKNVPVAKKWYNFFSHWYKNGSRGTIFFIVCNIRVQHFCISHEKRYIFFCKMVQNNSAGNIFFCLCNIFENVISFCIISLRCIQHFSVVYLTFLSNLSNIMKTRM